MYDNIAVGNEYLCRYGGWILNGTIVQIIECNENKIKVRVVDLNGTTNLHVGYLSSFNNVPFNRSCMTLVSAAEEPDEIPMPTEPLSFDNLFKEE